MNQISPNINNILSLLSDPPISTEEVNGGLFNYVYKISTANGKTQYLKIFTDKAKSDNFPPLPTSPQQRCFVAMMMHKIAHDASNHDTKVKVPQLLNYNLANCFVLMEESIGEPFFDSLINRDASRELIFVNYKTCLRWLAGLHAHGCQESKKISESSNLFKQYKIQLQYFNLIQLLPLKLRTLAKKFIEDYLSMTKHLVHGDLNSKNILINQENGNVINIIDFEQGHMGHGLYDVAYLCSELVIRMLLDENDNIEICIDDLLKSYSRELSDEEIINFRLHLAFQVLYRLVGPSNNTWSGHLSEPEILRAKSWALESLEKYFL